MVVDIITALGHMAVRTVIAIAQTTARTVARAAMCAGAGCAALTRGALRIGHQTVMLALRGAGAIAFAVATAAESCAKAAFWSVRWTIAAACRATRALFVTGARTSRAGGALAASAARKGAAVGLGTARAVASVTTVGA